MTTYGFCIAEQTDVPATERGRCVNDGDLLIAPSWNLKRPTWTPTGWHPHVERPEGHVYTPPAYLTGAPTPKPEPAPIVLKRPNRPPQKGLDSRPCRVCAKLFTPRRREQALCSTPCANAARRASASKQARIRRARPFVRSLEPIPCAACGTPFVPRPNGPPQRYCSKPCQYRAKNAARALPRPTVACATCGTPFAGRRFGTYGRRYCGEDCRRAGDRARAARFLAELGPDARCEDCGRTDAIWHSRTLCKACYKRSLRLKKASARAEAIA